MQRSEVPDWRHMTLEVAAKFSQSLRSAVRSFSCESLFPWSHDIFQWDQGAAVKLGINDIPVLDDSEEAISSPTGQTVADRSDQLVGISTFKRKPKQNRMSLHCSPSRKCMSPRPWKRRVSRFREWQLVSRMRQSHLTLRVTGTVHNSKSPDKFPL